MRFNEVQPEGSNLDGGEELQHREPKPLNRCYPSDRREDGILVQHSS